MTPEPSSLRIPAEALRRQIMLVLAAWGMAEDQARITAERMVEADLRGVDSHGIANLPLYDEFRRGGHVNFRANVRVVRETPVTALFDGDGGLGHYPSTLAIDLAIEKCAQAGLALAVVRNSNHYGAAGVYVLRAAEKGFIGLCGTNTYKASIVPTFAAEPMFGTNPLAFAAPAKRNPPFVLDMATSTAAIGKFKLALMHGKSVPEGWAVDEQGRPLTDPARAIALRLITPLGGTRELGSHKGYGLAAMVEILSAILPGALATPVRVRASPAGLFDIGHFFLAIDPGCFREKGAFEADLDAMIDVLHAARRADPGQPVLVAGDPEIAEIEARTRQGIPVPRPLLDAIRAIAEAAPCEFVLQARG
jgi:LDH2 family malate/lactate/ureidoglycolate dehydrogenase